MKARFGLLIGLLLAPLFADAQTITGNRSAYQTLFTTGTAVGNGADITEDTVLTYVIPANTLANVGDRLHIVTAGTFVSSTDSKSARVRIAANLLTFETTVAANATVWAIDGYIMKTGTNTQSYMFTGTQSVAFTGAQTGVKTYNDSVNETLTLTLQNATNPTAASVNMQFFTISYIPVGS